MIEHIEQGTLPSGCKAVIALTSWKKRINTVGLTIYNLFETCGPDYHIVLTLAEEEFPKKEQELPRDLVLMNKAGVFEILWVKMNSRSLKKWCFCGMKYPFLPVITADDDCLYRTNFASILYDSYINVFNESCDIISWIEYINSGQGLLIAPSIRCNLSKVICDKMSQLPRTSIDSCIEAYLLKYHPKVFHLRFPRCTVQHTNVSPINMTQYSKSEKTNLIRQICKII